MIWFGYDQQKMGLVNLVEENITTPPISNIQVGFGHGMSCSKGFKDFIFGSWPGTYDGCFCPIPNTLNTGTCSDKNSFFPDHLQSKNNLISADGDIRYKTALLHDMKKSNDISTPSESAEKQVFSSYYGCHTIQSIPSHDLQVWKGRKLCVRYYSADEYYWTSYPCKPDFKRCQPGLCIKSTLLCPVTSIDINTLNNSMNGVALSVSRDISKPGLLKLQMTEEAEYPCLANNRESRITGYSYYPLLRAPDGCGRFGTDNSSILIDSELETDLYFENGLGYTISILPKYTEYLENRKVSLYARQRLQINAKNENCLTIDPHKFHKAIMGNEEEKKYLDKIIEWNCFLDPQISQLMRDIRELSVLDDGNLAVEAQ